MYSIEEFIQELANERTDKLGFSENLYSGTTRESIIRKHNLLTYLTKMKSLNPRILLLGEAPGNKGCKLTGIPFTSWKKRSIPTQGKRPYPFTFLWVSHENTNLISF